MPALTKFINHQRQAGRLRASEQEGVGSSPKEPLLDPETESVQNVRDRLYLLFLYNRNLPTIPVFLKRKNERRSCGAPAIQAAS